MHVICATSVRNFEPGSDGVGHQLYERGCPPLPSMQSLSRLRGNASCACALVWERDGMRCAGGGAFGVRGNSMASAAAASIIVSATSAVSRSPPGYGDFSRHSWGASTSVARERPRGALKSASQGSRLKSAYLGVRPEFCVRLGNTRCLDDRMTKSAAAVAVAEQGGFRE